MNAGKDIRDYLLGALSPDRMEEIEQRILADDDFHEEVEIAEEELLDSYVQGKLVGGERQLFESHFLASPLRQQRLKFALAFQKKLSSAANTAPNRIRNPINLYPYALAASLLLAAFLGSMNYLSSKAIQEERDNVARLRTQLEQLRQQASAVSPNSVFSTPDLLPTNRGPGQSPVVVSEGVVAIRFNLIAPADVQGKVGIDLLNDAGQVIFSQEGNQVEQVRGNNMVTATIERKFLNPGNYFLRVKSPQSPSRTEYSFQVAFSK